MSALLPLRKYQRDAIDSFRAAISPEVNRIALVFATGLGKTVIFAHAAAEHVAEHPEDRVLVLVHTDELVRQAAKKIRDVAPHLAVGIVKASQNEVTADVIVASVQTLRSEKRRAQIRGVGLVIVDECHHATASTYRAILEHYGCMDGRTPALGVTATLMRGDGGPLGEIWQTVAASRSISYGVRQGFLIPPRGRAVEVADLNLSAVKQTRKDFREGELGAALADSLAPGVIADAYVEHAKDRSGIMFCPTVASAEVMADAMNAAGIPTEVIHGGLDMETRRAILDRLESGATQVLANCMVLTEGFDSPRVSCVVVARPTKSKGLYIQMVGRGLRVDPTRPYADQDCLVLDVVGAYGQHDLCSLADLSEKPIDPKVARQGKSLIDLEDEFDRGEGVEPDAPEHWSGPVEVREFDPLSPKSRRVWQRTQGGAYVMPAGEGAYVFLAQHGPDAYTVVWCTRYGTPWVCPSRLHDDTCTAMHGRVGGITAHRALPLEMAIGWAEDLAVDMGGIVGGRDLSDRKAAWRRARIHAGSRTPNAGRARALGIEIPAHGINAGELSDLIDKVTASRVVDPWLPRVVAALTNTERNEGWK